MGDLSRGDFKKIAIFEKYKKKEDRKHSIDHAWLFAKTGVRLGAVNERVRKMGHYVLERPIGKNGG